MLEAIRARAQTKLAKIILALILIPFALWGIDSYFDGGGASPAVASVDGDDVGQREFFRALKNQRDTLEQQRGIKVDVANKEFRDGVLKEIIDTYVLRRAALDNGLIVSAAEIEAMIHSAPLFQADGKFSPQAFDAWLRQQELGEKEVLRMLQDDALTRQLQFGYGEGGIVSGLAIGQLAGILAQQREVNELHFEAGAYQKAVNIDDKAVEAEYNAHQADYSTPAQVRLQYLVLSAEALREQIKISDETARQYYTANTGRFQEPEQRRASHILIKVDGGAAPEVQQAAKAKADALYQELTANPGRFAELAKKESQDPGSAARGGDLGEFTRDMMVRPFADAAFGMKAGELRGPVQTEFGYHIIRLDGIKPGVVQPFEAVKASIADELAMQQVQRMFAEMAERLSNLVYEKPDSLEPAAKEFKLSLQESDWISKDAPSPASLASAQLMETVFAPESLAKRQNTEAIEVAPGLLVAARVIDHKPAGVRPLGEVAGDIRLKLTALAARNKAIEAGKQALQALQSGEAVSGLAPAKLVSRMQPANLSAEALKAIFKADVGKLPASVGVETRRGYSVYRINKVVQAAADEERRKSLERDLTRMQSQAELTSYLQYRRSKADIVINSKALEEKSE